MGKTSTQIDRDTTPPIEIPRLMMGFTADGQLKPEMIANRGNELKISAENVRKARVDLASAPPVQPGSDGWQRVSRPSSP
jgi:hypothetical protein